MLITSILSVVVLTIVNGMPSNSDDVGDGEYFKACMEWTKCTSEGKDRDDEFSACVKMAPKEKAEKLVKNIGAFAENEWPDIPAIFIDYCAMTEEKKVWCKNCIFTTIHKMPTRWQSG
ncbi:uncharacterized protein [Parasteatoda tepidariorum]|uniref:uncharacterized protein n=1 Tax=Parasteatoda tepidariorum TaxID=114398 RepID=UPI0039BC2D26